MGTKARIGISVMIVSMALLFVVPSIPTTTSTVIPDRPFLGVIDRHLLPMLRSDGDTSVQVLVRYRSFPVDDDISMAEGLGLTLVASMRSIPVVTFKGDPSMVERLSGEPRVVWIENDDPVDLSMERSLLTINATLAWDSWVESARRVFPSITGEGITVAVVDTGIDAGHPDLDYGEKTIINLKSDIPGGPWREMENSDTSYGHGTHCAGTIAGNGDASAGARRGVAPDARLIGLCVGDVGITLTNTLQGLDWVYQNSRPPNPYNIKVVSNSWGGGAAEYDPEDATSIICQKLTYENNVLVVFAMGNAGQGQHSGETLTASPTGLIPSNIGVAAFERDGSGVATFSSRGERGKNQTYPDIGAPGVKIWSAHARATEISAISKLQGNPNPYYLAISGTSMATPHVSGLAALMFQAAPSLRISDRFEDYSGEDNASWYGNDFNRIHEIEWIMEQSAHYLPPDGIPLSDEAADNGVPEPGDIGPTEVGWDGKPIDWAQGYGLVDAQRCVGIALTLENLRNMYPDREWDPADAIAIYESREVFHASYRNLSTDTLFASWSGEFARYAQDRDQPILVQNQTRLVYVPEGATEVTFLLQYDAISLREVRFSDLTFTVDYGWDGSADYDHPFFGSRTSGTKQATLQVTDSNSGMYWAIGIYGRGFKALQPFRDGQYFELRVEYSMGVSMTMSIPENGTISVVMPPSSSMLSRWEEGPPSAGYAGGTVSMTGTVFDVERMHPFEEVPEETGGGGFPMWVLALMALAAIGVGAYAYSRRRRANAKG